MLKHQLRGAIQASKSSLILALAVLPLSLAASCGVEPGDDVATVSQGLGPDCSIKRPYAWHVATTCFEALKEQTLSLAPGESETFEAGGGIRGEGSVTVTCHLNGDGLWSESFKSCQSGF